MIPPLAVLLSVAGLGVSFAGSAYEWLLLVMLARPMLAFVLVLADVAEA